MQSRVRPSRKLSPALLAQKLAIWSHTNLDLKFPRLKAGFGLWLAWSSTGGLISSPTVVQGTSYVDNALRRILVPRAGQKVVVKYTGSLPLSVTVYGAARSYGEHVPIFKALSIVFNPETKLIDLTLFEERQDVPVPLSLQFQYCPSQGFAPIHEIASDRNKRIKQFYWKLWFGDKEVLPNLDIHEKFVGPDATINSSDVEQFCAVAGNLGESFKVARNDNVQAPMDFAIVTCWKVIFIPSLHTLILNFL